jgi:aerobic carbon-monoxide dehydrogenase medium subunit
MKPPPFSYHDPHALSDAIDLLGRLDNAKLLAGGQSLMPMLNMRFVLPDHIIDLNRVEGLAYIRDTGDALDIGAMTRQRDLEYSDLVAHHCPLMHEAIRLVGHRQTRNRGTLGGSLCHLDPSAELVTCAAALDATVTVQGPGSLRQIAFAEFPVAFMTPAIEPNELLTAVRFATWPPGHGHGFVEFARRHGDFAIVSAAALLAENGKGEITRASVTLGGVGVAPIRCGEVEAALLGAVPDDKRLREASELCRKFEAIDDVHASSSYRQHLATVMARRALERARDRLPSQAAATTRTH